MFKLHLEQDDVTKCVFQGGGGGGARAPTPFSPMPIRQISCGHVMGVIDRQKWAKVVYCLMNLEM